MKLGLAVLATARATVLPGAQPEPRLRHPVLQRPRPEGSAVTDETRTPRKTCRTTLPKTGATDTDVMDITVVAGRIRTSEPTVVTLARPAVPAGQTVGVEAPSVVGAAVLLDGSVGRRPTVDELTAVIPVAGVVTARAVVGPTSTPSKPTRHREMAPLTPLAAQQIEAALHESRNATAEATARRDLPRAMGAPTLEANPGPKMDTCVRWLETAILPTRPRPTTVVTASARRVRPTEPLVTGVKGPPVVIQTKRPAGHQPAVTAAHGAEVEDTKGRTLSAPVLRTMEAIIGRRVSRTESLTPTEVGTKVVPTARTVLPHAAEPLNGARSVGQPAEPTIPHAKTKERADPTVSVGRRATVPPIATLNARVGGEVGVALPAGRRRQGPPG